MDPHDEANGFVSLASVMAFMAAALLIANAFT